MGNFIFEMILLLLGSFFLLMGLINTSGESRFGAVARVVATLVGIFLIFMAIGEHLTFIKI